MITSSFSALPIELWLEIIPHLELKSLIAIRCTSRALRTLAASADIHPCRKSFLDLYLDLIDRAWFLESRPWPLKHLRPFDRQAYLDAIAAFPNVYIPEDFAMWILEWPERTVTRCLWPGLPFAQGDDRRDPVQRRPGWNGLGMMPPTVHTFTMVDGLENGDREITHVPGLLLFDETSNQIEFLLLHRGERFKGYVVAGVDECFDTYILSHPECGEPFWTSWIAYLEEGLIEIESRYEPHRPSYTIPSDRPSTPGLRRSASLATWPSIPS
ncbi:hypothetical protein HGRIS_006119 [Hohenbuehelia grisea]|uniref:F-box domain-containing protein n=1 Tax=Hohenbuehelia grisea TaxID=104357 RepID=A0ABR3JZS8_9AGAR